MTFAICFRYLISLILLVFPCISYKSSLKLSKGFSIFEVAFYIAAIMLFVSAVNYAFNTYSSSTELNTVVYNGEKGVKLAKIINVDYAKSYKKRYIEPPRKLGIKCNFVGSFMSQFPINNNATNIRASSFSADGGFLPHFATKADFVTIGSTINNAWLSEDGAYSGQKFNIDLGNAKLIHRIYLENYRGPGSNVNPGIKRFYVYGSNSYADFDDLNFNNLSPTMKLLGRFDNESSGRFDSQAQRHGKADSSFPQFFYLTDNGAGEYTNDRVFRFYIIRISSNYGGNNMGFRVLQLQTGDCPQSRVNLKGDA